MQGAGHQSSKHLCSQLHSCSQYCHVVDFGLCALAKRSPWSSLNLQQGCIRMTQVIHNCACTTVYIQCNGLSIYSTVFESTYGCYPTKWQFGRKLFLFFFLIWHANDCFFFFYHEIVNISPLLFQIRECGNNLRQHTVLLPMWDI